jgi:hypothetical protein
VGAALHVLLRRHDLRQPVLPERQLLVRVEQPLLQRLRDRLSLLR